MRCLSCGKQLALFRRLTGGGEFCSDAHKRSYQEEYNRLALTRLIAAQTPSEQRKPVSMLPSTMQIAAAERQGAVENRTKGVNNRWGTSPVKARMLEAPAEAPPPQAASFVLRKPDPRISEAALPGPALEFIPATLPLSGRDWNPQVAINSPPPPGPPAADAMDLGLPSPSETSFPAAAALTISEPVFQTSALEIKMSIQARSISGLRPRPAIALTPLQFAPKVQSKPDFDRNFESLHFAFMFFGEPTLDVISEPDTLVLEAVEETQAASSGELPEPLQQRAAAAQSVGWEHHTGKAPPRLPSLDSRRPSTVRLKPASFAEPATADPVAVPSTEKEKPRPKLPTLSATGRRLSPPMLSILQAPEPSRNRSLWDSIRKYIKK